METDACNYRNRPWPLGQELPGVGWVRPVGHWLTVGGYRTGYGWWHGRWVGGTFSDTHGNPNPTKPAVLQKWVPYSQR